MSSFHAFFLFVLNGHLLPEYIHTAGKGILYPFFEIRQMKAVFLSSPPRIHPIRTASYDEAAEQRCLPQLETLRSFVGERQQGGSTGAGEGHTELTGKMEIRGL